MAFLVDFGDMINHSEKVISSRLIAPIEVFTKKHGDGEFHPTPPTV